MKNGSGIDQIERVCKSRKILYYVGSSTDFNHRAYDHFYALREGTHANSNLQNAFDKYTHDEFVFSILLYCEPFELLRYEMFFIRYLKPYSNVSMNAGNTHRIKIRRKKIKRSNIVQRILLSNCLECGKNYLPRNQGSTLFLCAECTTIYC